MDSSRRSWSTLPEPDFRKFADCLFGEDQGQAVRCLLIEAFRVDSAKLRQVTGQLLQPLAQLPFRSRRISTSVVVETDSDVDEALQKETQRTALAHPDFFPRLMTLKERAPIEEFHTMVQWTLHLSGCARNHSSVRRRPSSK